MSDQSDQDEKKNGEENGKKHAALAEETPPVETQHTLKLADRTLRYKAAAGMLPIKNETDEIQAQMFFVAYTLETDRPANRRPLIFVFNGGPGSSSVWLHLGALGPQRVRMEDEGWMPMPPYELVPNQHTWLDMADLVFIDPVGTGYSRAVKPEDNKKYWNLQADFESVGEFIRLYLTRYERWASPLFLAGESYGTTRAAGVAGHLITRGIAFSGVILISTVLNFQTLLFAKGNDLPFILFLPTYAATAWYHGRLPQELQQKPLRAVLDEVEAWAETEYTLALQKGDRLDAEAREAIIARLAYFTGLEPRYIDYSDLGINIMRFCKELLRTERRTVGRLDSRFKGRDALAVTEFPEFDPSMAAITPPYTATMNDYVRRVLGYKTDIPYEILSYTVNREWEWDRGRFADTSEALRSAMTRNPHMQVFAGMGLYDLATPHFATHYTLNHMSIDPELRQNLHMAEYEAGHMFYLDVTALARLRQDVVGFLAKAVTQG
ncbi:MAG: S10 family peptidase [Chloroflexota bacterium]